MTRRALIGSVAVAAALAVLALSPAAAAHGGGGALGFRSTVTTLEPALPGVSVTVLDSDDRLELRNASGKRLIVLGYQSEPYLDFRDGKVFHNVRSPATYLNDDRFGKVTLPARADPKAAPEWEEASPRETYAWHDHRIHWMSPKLPPRVEAAKDDAQHVFDWEVPATLGGRALTISGSLDYEPPREGDPTILVVLLVVVALLGAGLVWLRRVRRGAELPN